MEEANNIPINQTDDNIYIIHLCNQIIRHYLINITEMHQSSILLLQQHPFQGQIGSIFMKLSPVLLQLRQAVLIK